MLGIITYDAPHLKTEQLVHGLLLRGESVTAIYALPFQPRPTREVLFAHRPAQSHAAHPRSLARAHGIAYRNTTRESLRIEEPLALVAIGVLIPEASLEGTRVINCHPGVIPQGRGLDAFKWAIHDGLPLGHTLHYIDSAIDCGEIICTRPTPVYPEDTIERLAARHYEHEIMLNAGFREFLPGEEHAICEQDLAAPARRRMPMDTEQVMLERFPAYVRQFAVSAS